MFQNMCTPKYRAVCGLLLDKPVIHNTLDVITKVIIFFTFCFMTFGIGVGWSKAWELINDNNGLYCMNWAPVWYCFWYGIWLEIMILAAILLIVLIGFILWTILKYINSIREAIHEVAEQTKLIKGEDASLITNITV